MAYLERLGEQGLRSVARQCHDNLGYALNGLLQIPQCRSKFDGARFHEVVVEFDGVDLDAVLSLCARHGIQPGFALARDYAELDSCLLVHVSETHLRADIDTMLARLTKVIEVQAQATCPVSPRF
jgi:glycine dehydrogenase subunit 1